MSSNYTTTLATNGVTFSLSPQVGEYRDKPKTPSGLIVTAAVQTKEGWLGQVIVDKEIVFESGACDNADAAVEIANKRVVDVIKALFASPTT
jgi:hypothetical protein